MQYQLRVLRQGQAPYQFELEAISIEDARNKAEQQGLIVLQVKSTTSSLLQKLTKQSTQFPLILFSQEFRVLFEAGLSVMDVLQTLIEKESNPSTKLTLQQLLIAVQEGKTLSQAMSLNVAAFPTLFIATISAAETTGDLAEALLRYSQYLENVDLLKKRIVSASVYPAIVTSFGLLVLAFLVVFVIPKFSRIYATQVANISSSTQFLLQIGEFSQQYGAIILVLVVSLITTLVILISRQEIRAKFYDALWKIPFLGNKVRVYHLSRFYRTFSMLLKSGIPVMNSLAMVESLLGAGLKSNLHQAKKQIAEGKQFSQALFDSELTTPVAMRLFNVGEKTGTLDKMMERAASFHEEEMIRWVDRFTKIFEPTLMAVIGILIGGIVLMMYLPIFELASGIE
ncbi:MAG: type II secretion system F family protein [Methylotenera sp.]|uniref:type II secretion system F family protein n=1 Tax=Methylotenera sp. TaxID=2051956 RepID=UPI00181EF1BD|nr:type II secretion system F family protein [Methylotenera sp.]NOU25061.1 type II secretion system F family protein [Methylotenera sp.]